jgi:hypothetical protein
VRGLDARVAAVIRIDAVWLAVNPIDMRTGVDRLLVTVVQVFGAAQAHHGYVFAKALCALVRDVLKRRRPSPGMARVGGELGLTGPERGTSPGSWQGTNWPRP